MTTSFHWLRARMALLPVAHVTSITATYAQVPSVSSLRATPSEIEKIDPRISQIIARAENHFKQGQLNLTDNKREQARDEFDRAVDVILESGVDVRANPRLQNF